MSNLDNFVIIYLFSNETIQQCKISQWDKKNPIISINNDTLGTTLHFVNFYSLYHLITHNQISIIKSLKIDKLTENFQVIKCCLMEEN